MRAPIPLYGTDVTLACVRDRFAYAFINGSEGSTRPALDLIEKSRSLFERIVQLRETVRDLHAAHEEFKAVRELRVIGAALGQGRDLDRVVDHVGRLDKALFGEVAEQRLDGLAVRQLLVLGGRNALPPARRDEASGGHQGSQRRRTLDVRLGH